MLKKLIIIIVLFYGIGDSCGNELTKNDNEEYINAAVVKLFEEYGYEKSFSEETKSKIRLKLVHQLRELVQNERAYYSYGLYLLNQLNKGDSDHIINKLLFNHDWLKQYDNLKAIYLTGYPNKLSEQIIRQMSKSHWLVGIQTISEKLLEDLKDKNLTSGSKFKKWKVIESEFYYIFNKCDFDNRINRENQNIIEKKINDNKLLHLLKSNNIPINKLKNLSFNIGKFKLISTFLNQIVTVDDYYNLDIITTGSLRAERFIEINNIIFVTLNGYDSIGHDRLFTLKTNSEKLSLKYLFTFLYLIEDIKLTENKIVFTGSNWSMALNTQSLEMSDMNICGKEIGAVIGL